MPDTAKYFLVLGALAALLGVALGAFGAHVLKARLSMEMLEVYQKAVQYQLWHALALLVIGILTFHLPESMPLKYSGWLMILGIVLFSGSLYLMAISGKGSLGMITPIGGLAWIAAWVLLIFAVIRA